MTDRLTASQRHAAKQAGDIDPTHPGDSSDQQSPSKPTKKAKPRCRNVGGSASDKFNLAIARSTLDTFWITSKEDSDKAADVMVAALSGIAPQDEIEGMIAGQMVAAHQASIECFRRAMLPEQTIESRAMNLSAANKSSKTYATLLDALNRHRGKGGQQRVVVEHVTVHEGGQAIVGAVEHGKPRGRGSRKSQGQPHAKSLAYAPGAALWSEDTQREAVPVTVDDER